VAVLRKHCHGDLTGQERLAGNWDSLDYARPIAPNLVLPIWEYQIGSESAGRNQGRNLPIRPAGFLVETQVRRGLLSKALWARPRPSGPRGRSYPPTLAQDHKHTTERAGLVSWPE
jgi:hypothetical protein